MDDDGVYFFQPTILLNTTQKMDIMSEETFGTLLPVQGFTDIDAALDLANGLPFGLAAYYFTETTGQDYILPTGLNLVLSAGMTGRRLQPMHHSAA